MSDSGNCKTSTLKSQASSTTLADWQGICILAAIDLYSIRLASVSPPPVAAPAKAPGESAWIQSEIALFQADAKAISPSCSSIVQSTIATMLGVPAATYRASWKSLLQNPTGFGTVSFGVWLKGLPLADLKWPAPATPPKAADPKPNFYSVLFFADMQSMFVGALANLESYWSGSAPNITIYSAEVLLSHYWVQANSVLTTYSTSLICLANVISGTNFFPPYGSGYNTLVNLMNAYLPATAPAWDPIIPTNKHTLAWAQYLSQAASNPMVTFPANNTYASGLNDLGNYIDGAAQIVNQVKALKAAIDYGYSNNQFCSKLAEIKGYCDRTVATSLGGIVNGLAANDGTSPYAGFHVAPMGPTTGTQSGFIDAVNSSIVLSSYTFVFTEGETVTVYSNSPLAEPPPPILGPPPPPPAAAILFSLDGYTGVTVPSFPDLQPIQCDASQLYTAAWAAGTPIVVGTVPAGYSALINVCNVYAADGVS